ncbi:rRNA-binding ribosome biosynthesis protein utp25, partial [Rhizophlyctis rosea]
MSSKRKLPATAASTTDDWSRPNSFNKLLKNLKKSSKRSTTFRPTSSIETPVNNAKTVTHKNKKPRLAVTEVPDEITGDDFPAENGEGFDNNSGVIGSGDVEDMQSEDGSENGDDAELEDELADDQGDSDDDAEGGDNVEGAAEDDEDEDEDEAGAGADPFFTQFSDSISTTLPLAAAQLSQNAWILSKDEDPILKSIISYNMPNSNSSLVNLDQTVSLESLKIKTRLHTPFKSLNEPLLPTVDQTTPFTPLQSRLIPPLNTYKDIMFTNETHATARELRHMYCLHAVNHVFKTRDKVLKNTAKIKAAGEEGKETLDIRDQGFTRPKVLILLPFRNTALEVVKMLIALSGTKQQDNKKRFMDEFGVDPENDVVDPKKPEDHKKSFAGNIDDCFRVGIKFSRKQMKLFAPFYGSDIIVASPLGLRMVIGAEGDKKRDFDFLSSIEMVILDNSEVFLMQNWDHVQHIFEHLNLIPKDPHGCDFSRVRSYYLDGRAKNVRQTLLFSSLQTPHLTSLFQTQSHNPTGRLKILHPLTGTISQVHTSLPQLFHRIPVPHPSQSADLRFDFFKEKIMPSVVGKAGNVVQGGTVIFVSDYFDFVRVRNWVKG